jgi:hypothetical protein
MNLVYIIRAPFEAARPTEKTILIPFLHPEEGPNMGHPRVPNWALFFFCFLDPILA